MPEADEEVIRRVYERWNTNSGDLALDLFDPEVEVRQIPMILDTAGTFHGHQGLRASARELVAAFETIRWQPAKWLPSGAWMIVPLRIVATGRGSGIDAEVEVTHAWRVRNGLVTDLHVYADPDEARRELDLAG
jgi:ketosteroid isomerase-like protein